MGDGGDIKTAAAADEDDDDDDDDNDDCENLNKDDSDNKGSCHFRGWRSDSFSKTEDEDSSHNEPQA